jgi:hypothetical protein
VNGSFLHRFRLPLAAIATALAAWFILPGSSIDRFFFTSAVRGFANPPFFISGAGSHAEPWKLRTFIWRNRLNPDESPPIVVLDDDAEGFFQSSPPSPIDLAVILTNFQRLGASSAACAAVLDWESPDPIGLAALDQALARFDSLVMTAPLTRAAVPEHLPPSFRRASLPLSSAEGDTSLLPVVNRIPLPGVILGGDKTLAGFQTIDSAPAGRYPPLIARWDDRLVFAFPVLTALQRLGLAPDALEIRLGKYLKLGPNGPTVPIDSFGRLAVPAKPLPPHIEIPAADLIDASPGVFPASAPAPVILADHRSAAEPATRAFSRNLPFVIATIASDGGLTPPRGFQRLKPTTEILGLLALTMIFWAFAKLPPFSRTLAWFVCAGLLLAALFLATTLASLWLPALPALASLGVVVLISLRSGPQPVPTTSPEIRTPRPLPPPTPPPAPAALAEVSPPEPLPPPPPALLPEATPEPRPRIPSEPLPEVPPAPPASPPPSPPATPPPAKPTRRIRKKRR